jgi:hypothetical protein
MLNSEFDIFLSRFQTLSKLEYTFINCSKSLPISEQRQPDAKDLETYYEKEMVSVLIMHIL